jgi:UDP-N-acetyl-2-amino-2-deoxyglucuronate dehydrogenase
MPEKVCFAVVGWGHIGRRHADLIRLHPEGKLIAIIDSDQKLSGEIKKTYGDSVSFFANEESFYKSNIQADVICICTPNGLHAQQSLKALENNCHVVCEKPMALHKADCENVIYTALQKHKLIFCVMQNRYSPPSQWLKSVMDENLLGKIFLVQINCYWNRDERYYKKDSWKGSSELDGGPLFTQFSHFIDMMYWLFGDIKNIQSRLKNFSHSQSTHLKDDSGFITFDFANGSMGSFNYSTSVWDKNIESSMTIIGENGTIKVGGQYMEKVEYCNIKNYTMPELLPSNPPNDYGPYKGSAANHHFIIDNVIDTIKGRTTITTNAMEGLKVVDIIERMYAAHS